VEQQTGPAIPKLSHLRESGSIEQDADVVMFIYRKAADRKYNIEDLPESEQNIAEIYIAKHRNGPTGRIKLYFDEETVSFKNLEKKSFEEPPAF
jgi:replicative DNA helicase